MVRLWICGPIRFPLPYRAGEAITYRSLMEEVILAMFTREARFSQQIRGDLSYPRGCTLRFVVLRRSVLEGMGLLLPDMGIMRPS